MRFLRKWIRTNSFIKTSVTSWNKHYQFHKIMSLHVKEHCIKKYNILLIFIRFVFSQTAFKFSPVFIGTLHRFRFNLVTFWLLIFYGSCSSFASSTSLLIRIIKILNRLNVDFYRVFNLNMFLLCSYFPWNIVTCWRQKNNSGRGCLIMVSANLMSCLASSLLANSKKKCKWPILTFCIRTSLLQNVLNLLLFSKQVLAFCSYNDFVYKKCMMFLADINV